MQQRTKNPERVRLGRLGALTLHASGKTTTAAARAAWEASVAAEFGISDELDPRERDRRMGAAMRARMTRLSMARWANKKAAEGQSPAAFDGGGTHDADSAS